MPWPQTGTYTCTSQSRVWTKWDNLRTFRKNFRIYRVSDWTIATQLDMVWLFLSKATGSCIPRTWRTSTLVRTRPPKRAARCFASCLVEPNPVPQIKPHTARISVSQYSQNRGDWLLRSIRHRNPDPPTSCIGIHSVFPSKRAFARYSMNCDK